MLEQGEIGLPLSIEGHAAADANAKTIIADWLMEKALPVLVAVDGGQLAVEYMGFIEQASLWQLQQHQKAGESLWPYCELPCCSSRQVSPPASTLINATRGVAEAGLPVAASAAPGGRAVAKLVSGVVLLSLQYSNPCVQLPLSSASAGLLPRESTRTCAQLPVSLGSAGLLHGILAISWMCVRLLSCTRTPFLALLVGQPLKLPCFALPDGLLCRPAASILAQHGDLTGFLMAACRTMRTGHRVPK